MNGRLYLAENDEVELAVTPSIPDSSPPMDDKVGGVCVRPGVLPVAEAVPSTSESSLTGEMSESRSWLTSLSEHQFEIKFHEGAPARALFSKLVSILCWSTFIWRFLFSKTFSNSWNLSLKPHWHTEHWVGGVVPSSFKFELDNSTSDSTPSIRTDPKSSGALSRSLCKLTDESSSRTLALLPTVFYIRILWFFFLRLWILGSPGLWNFKNIWWASEHLRWKVSPVLLLTLARFNASIHDASIPGTFPSNFLWLIRIDLRVDRGCGVSRPVSRDLELEFGL